MTHDERLRAAMAGGDLEELRGFLVGLSERERRALAPAVAAERKRLDRIPILEQSDHKTENDVAAVATVHPR